MRDTHRPGVEAERVPALLDFPLVPPHSFAVELAEARDEALAAEARAFRVVAGLEEGRDENPSALLSMLQSEAAAVMGTGLRRRSREGSA